MNKGLIVAGVIVLLAVAGYFLFASGDLRGDIEKLYYKNNVEDCGNAVAEGFDSEEHCKAVIKCVAEEVAQIIKEDDLKQVRDDMKTDDAGKVFSDYRTNNPSIDEVMRLKALACLE